MSIFSKQKCCCRACGAEMFVALSAPGWVEVCGKECYEELEWRWTLSTMGKEYYPKGLVAEEPSRAVALAEQAADGYIADLRLIGILPPKT